MGKKSSTKPAAIAIDLFRAWDREGAKKGAKARWAGVSPEQRRAGAKKAGAVGEAQAALTSSWL